MRGKHGRLRSFHHFSFQMLQRGGGNTKFVWQFHSYSGTQEFENGEVVDGVSDAEHDFPSQIRPHRSGLGFAITHAVRHGTLPLENFARKASEFIDQTFGYKTGARHRALQLPVPTPLIVVDLASPNAFHQTEKVIEHVPIVGSEGRRGLFAGWALKRASVRLVADAIQKDAALLQDIFRRSMQWPGHHVRTLSPIPEFACGARTEQ
jgi:hypothetical protein